MGDDQHGAVAFLAIGGDGLAHHAQGVHVKTAVGLVQDGQLRLQQQELQHLQLLAFAAGEAHIELTVQDGLRQAQALHHGSQALLVALAVKAQPLFVGRRQGTQVTGVGHSRHLHRRLEAQEESRAGAQVGRKVGDVLAREGDGARRHLIAGIAGNHLPQGGLPCPVGAHEHMGGALVDV